MSTSSPEPSAWTAATLLTPVSLESALASGSTNNLNIVRLVAATAVVVSHSFPVGEGVGAMEPLSGHFSGRITLGGLAVCVFFLLSGMLVTRSAASSGSGLVFMRKRALRLLPGLWLLMIVSVAVIGPLCTSLGSAEYWRSGLVPRYLQGAFFRFGTELPGVYASNPYPLSVNNSLWSVRVEAAFYLLSLPLVYLRSRRIGAGVTVCLLVGSYALSHVDFTDAPGRYSVFVSAAGVLHYYLLGTCAYFARGHIHLSPPLALVALLGWIGAGDGLFFPEATGILLGYAVLVVGVHPGIRLPRITGDADLSYGVYLYGFPIQQTVAHFGGAMRWYENAVLSLLALLPMAAISWFAVERTALRWK